MQSSTSSEQPSTLFPGCITACSYCHKSVGDNVDPGVVTWCNDCGMDTVNLLHDLRRNLSFECSDDKATWTASRYGGIPVGKCGECNKEFTKVRVNPENASLLFRNKCASFPCGGKVTDTFLPHDDGVGYRCRTCGEQRTYPRTTIHYTGQHKGHFRARCGTCRKTTDTSKINYKTGRPELCCETCRMDRNGESDLRAQKWCGFCNKQTTTTEIDAWRPNPGS